MNSIMNENGKKESSENNDYNNLSRDEIRVIRRERRQQKKIENQAEKLNHEIQTEAENAKIRASDKVTIIGKSDFQHYQSNHNNNKDYNDDTKINNQNTKHGKYFNNTKKDFNLLDFANKTNHYKQVNDKKTANKQILPNHYSGRFQNNLNSGKKREDGVKSRSKLKKIIIKNRQNKKVETNDKQKEKLDAQADIQIGAQADIQTDAQTDVQSEAHPDVQSDAQTDVQVNAPTDGQVDIQTDIETDVQTNTVKINEVDKLEVPDLTLKALEKLEITDKDTSNQKHDDSKTSDDPKNNRRLIYSRRFRSYCDNITSPDLCKLTEDLLRELFRFQKRAYEKNQIKSRAHKRYVFGFREVRNNLLANKLKLVIIAPDIEPCNIEGGLDDTVNEIKEICNENNVPYLFSLSKRKLAYCCFKKASISCIGILFYDGAQDIFYKLIECMNADKDRYQKLTIERSIGLT